MPLFDTREPPYKKTKSVEAEWNTFKRGLNLLLRPTELSREELAQADNMMLVGSGVPTGRWGTSVYFTANTSGTIRGSGTYKSKDGVHDDIFVLTDEGYLAKKNGTSYSRITGASWASGSVIHTEQLGNKTFIVSENAPLTSYAGVDLTIFATISAPTGVSATNFSGATGTNQVSYKVVTLGANGGQTTPSTNYVLVNLPNDLTRTEVHVFWTAPSAATLAGYEIYRGNQGDETFLATTAPGVTKYVDRGEPSSEITLAPITNTTGGIKSKFIKKYKDRLLFVEASDPNKLVISGRYPNHTKTSWADGGGFIYIDPDSGDNITGIEVQPIADRIVVYKNFSSYLVDLQLVQIGNYYVLDPQYQPISTSVGCSSQDTLATVENDTFYFGRSGLYVTGYEPNFLNIIRTNEVSARIRPYLELLNDDDYATACAMYVNNKYILSFPLRKQMIIYDRERGAFMGPWTLPFGISYMRKYLDSTGTERWVLGSYDDNKIYTFEESLNSDNGTTISKTMRTNKESFGDWTRLYIMRYFYSLLRNVVGTATVNIYGEDRNGVTSTIKTFTITGAETNGITGWGTDMWGTAMWGTTLTEEAVVAADEQPRWGSLFKQVRQIQIEVQTSAAGSNFEFLKQKITAVPQGEGSLSSATRV